MAATDQQRAQFRQHLAQLLSNTNVRGRHDSEAMWLVGRLAASMLRDSGQRSWADLKAALSPEAYDSLIETIRVQGNRLHKDGRSKAVYAMDVLVTSIVGSRLASPVIAEGCALLDEIVDEAIRLYRKAEKARPAPRA